MNNPVLQCTALKKVYHEYRHSIEVLNAVDLTVKQGDNIAIVGASGSGKSTFLHLLGGLDRPTSGQIFINGIDWQTVSENKRCVLRNENLGFVYQFHHLLPEFTALENVAMPLLLAQHSISAARDQAKDMLDKVGLASRAYHKPAQLSGGERQRVAIARALVHRPKCVLADEPTGNLDRDTAAVVFDLMLSLNQALNTTLIIVTHDEEFAKKMDKIMTLKHANLVRKRSNKHSDKA